MNSFSESYKSAGVDVTAGYKAVELMKSQVAKTLTAGAIGGLGGFGGLFELPTGYKNPVLVSGTDGVGTKLKIAFLLDKHNTIGIDCVAMCVNDIITSGAKPLYFLDYIACGKNFPEKIAQIVEGVAEGCVQSGCALIGGETAEMPGFYPENEYDLAGFATGIVEKEKILKSDTQKEGDVLIALKSSGVHSNGFSLVRKVFSINEETIKRHYSEINTTLGECLLTPTKIYVKQILSLLEQVEVKAISHITGGGFYENIPRMLPKGLTAKIEKAIIKTPLIFNLIQQTGKIPERDMFNTFNMGVGMVLSLDKTLVDNALSILGDDAYILGELVQGEEGVILN
ncbi:MAG: phosphoribosylformylglycinamidine cyclo-ligase [Oscillospiraceae bacterium]|jgi:phosphoribosylformylglycinamidine cyclo-ligase|nr:phosphoribosylformylglycinamidine cyclo-ligase [Oscillospiraceae bacterium]